MAEGTRTRGLPMSGISLSHLFYTSFSSLSYDIVAAILSDASIRMQTSPLFDLFVLANLY
jgi:hypothetical protein